VCCFALAAPSAHAQQVPFTLNGSVYNNTVSISTRPDGGTWVTQGVYASPYSATLAGQSVQVFCVDVNDHSQFGQTYNPNVDISQDITNPAGSLYQAGNGGWYYNGGLASAITTVDYGVNGTLLTQVTAAQRASMVAYLADTYLSNPLYANGNSMSALSLVLWDIIQDGGDGFAQTSNGVFAASGGAVSLANTFLSAALNNKNYTTASNLIWVQSSRNGGVPGSHYQDYLVIGEGTNVVTTVPEPGAIVTGAFLFGTTGLGMIRAGIRRRKVGQNTLTA
jgi:hypothetical protein